MLQVRIDELSILRLRQLSEPLKNELKQPESLVFAYQKLLGQRNRSRIH